MTTITSLRPVDLIINALMFLDPKELATAKPTCKAFARMAEEAHRRILLHSEKIDDLRSRAFFCGIGTTPRQRAHYTLVLNLMQKIHSLFVGISDLDLGVPGALEEILASTRMAQLTSFHLDGWHRTITDAIAQRIVTLCPRLTYLQLGWSRVLTEAGASTLFKLKQLRSLSFYCSNVPAGFTAHVAKTSITEANFSGGRGMTGDAMRALLDAPKLTHLHVGGECGEQDTFRSQLAIASANAEKGGNLTHLFMRSAYYHPSKLIAIAEKCQNLVLIDLSNFNSEIIPDPQGLEAAMRAKNPKLQILGLTEKKA